VLANQGVDVNKAGSSHRNTALHYAARFGHLHCIDTLLRLRADPNLQNSEGRTPLHWAASNGTARAVQLLIDGRAKTHIRGRDGMTALELATHFNNAQTIPVLRAAALWRSGALQGRRAGEQWRTVWQWSRPRGARRAAPRSRLRWRRSGRRRRLTSARPR